jgi:Flp pilus assembly protein TadD
MILALAGALALPLAAPALAQSSRTAPMMTNDPAQMLRVARRLATQGEFSTAVNFYRRVLEIDPRNGEALGGLGDVLVALESPQEALGPYRDWASLAPSDPRPLLGQGRVLNRLNRPDEALPLLVRARGLGQPSVGVLTELGLALDLRGEFRQAQSAYAQAITLAPQSPELLQRFALSYGLSGDYEAALKLLHTLSKEASGADLVRRPLAMVYALSGQEAVAIRLTSSTESAQIAEVRRGFFRQVASLQGRARARAAHFAQLPNAPAPGTTQAPPPAITPQPESQPQLVPSVIGGGPSRIVPKRVALPQPAQEALPPNPVTADMAGAAPVTARAVPLPPADRTWVQLAAGPSRPALEQHWRALQGRAGAALDSLPPYVQPAQVNGRPVLRLVVGGYSDPSTAQALLGRLKGAGVPGLIQRTPFAADPLFP